MDRGLRDLVDAQHDVIIHIEAEKTRLRAALEDVKQILEHEHDRYDVLPILRKALKGE